jgi:hypothetical protein
VLARLIDSGIAAGNPTQRSERARDFADLEVLLHRRRHRSAGDGVRATTMNQMAALLAGGVANITFTAPFNYRAIPPSRCPGSRRRR